MTSKPATSGRVVREAGQTEAVLQQLRYTWCLTITHLGGLDFHQAILDGGDAQHAPRQGAQQFQLQVLVAVLAAGGGRGGVPILCRDRNMSRNCEQGVHPSFLATALAREPCDGSIKGQASLGEHLSKFSRGRDGTREARPLRLG